MPRVTKEKKVKNKGNKNKNASKSNKTNQSTKDEKFSFDEEIVIGLRRVDDEPKENRNHKKANNSQKKTGNKKTQKQKKRNKPKEGTNRREIEEPEIIIKSKYIQNYEEEEETKEDSKKKETKRKNVKKRKNGKNGKSQKLTKQQQITKKRRKLIFKIIKWLTLIGIIIAGIVYAMLSPIFNIQHISVTGNSKISSETIISLSDLNIGQNIFNFRTSNIVNNIKENAYIDSVDINRKFPDEIEIVVSEREATYMLMLGNAYVYINNQGYILEITSVKGDFTLLIGYETPEEQIQEGNRLELKDLERLNDILRIMDTASSMESEMVDLITQIDISDQSNYILTLTEEKKSIHLGDTTNLSTKILWINEFLESEKEKEGVIYLNVNLNSERPYFRERV